MLLNQPLLKCCTSVAFRSACSVRRAHSTTTATNGTDTDDVNFYNMVELFFDRAASIVEDKMVEESKSRDTPEMKRNKIHGILKVNQQTCEKIKIEYLTFLTNCFIK